MPQTALVGKLSSSDTVEIKLKIHPKGKAGASVKCIAEILVDFLSLPSLIDDLPHALIVLIQADANLFTKRQEATSVGKQY